MWTRVGALRDLEELLLGSGPNQDFPVEDAELQIMFPGDLRPLLSALRVLGLKNAVNLSDAALAHLAEHGCGSRLTTLILDGLITSYVVNLYGAIR